MFGLSDFLPFSVGVLFEVLRAGLLFSRVLVGDWGGVPSPFSSLRVLSLSFLFVPLLPRCPSDHRLSHSNSVQFHFGRHRESNQARHSDFVLSVGVSVLVVCELDRMCHPVGVWMGSRVEVRLDMSV